jgi:hypothetical protein
MRAFVIAVVLCIVVSAEASAQLPAQKGTPGKGTRPTAPPQGKTVASEPEKVPATNLTPKGGGKVRAAVVVNSVDYQIGILGYPANDGIVVMSTAQRRDLDQGGRIRCPAREIEVDFQNNGKTVTVRLEGGDMITTIGGYETKTIDQLVVAINSTNTPHALDITFIDWRTGNEYMGTINAMKVK